MIKVNTSLKIGKIGREAFLKSFINEIISNQLEDMHYRTVVLDVDEGKGIVIESADYIIIDALENLIPNKDSNISEILMTDAELPTIIVRFHNTKSQYEIMFFEQDADLISFLFDADLRNKWIVS